MKGKIIGKIPYNGEGIINLFEYNPPMKFDWDRPAWCKIKYKGVVGWSACRFLIEDAPPEEKNKKNTGREIKREIQTEEKSASRGYCGQIPHFH